MSKNDSMKQAAAHAALEFIKQGSIVGVGTGSTVNYFIEALADMKHIIDGTVASSKASAMFLKEKGIQVFDLNTVNSVSIYVDGTDEINPHLQMIKGAGGALTGEKIIASVAKKFICIADQSKKVKALGKRSIAVEVIPMARSYVGREIVKLGGRPVYRKGFITDYGNIILDVHHLDISKPIELEEKINIIPGVVENGLFAKRRADILLLGTKTGVEKIIS